MQDKRSPVNETSLALFYMDAKEAVIAAGFADEVDWQESVALEDVTESTFLREAAWVVLAAGVRESVVRQRFGEVSEAFLHWRGAEEIVSRKEACRVRALEVFNNERKIDAIVEIAERVAIRGMSTVRDDIVESDGRCLQELPYIGPVTCRHLAKNLGIPTVKEDRHLVRLAKRAGYGSAQCMCGKISDVVGDSLSVVDIVLWRYITLWGVDAMRHAETVLERE